MSRPVFWWSWLRLAFTGKLWAAERIEFLVTVMLGAIAAIWFRDVNDSLKRALPHIW